MAWYHKLRDITFVSRTDSQDTQDMSWEYLRYLLTLKYGPAFDCGWDRIVWRTHNGNVVKLAYPGKHHANEEEAISAFPKARCKLLYVGKFPLIIMEELFIDDDFDTYHLANIDEEKYGWLNMIDGAQVGLNKRGEWVAFDLGGYRDIDNAVVIGQ